MASGIARDQGASALAIAHQKIVCAAGSARSHEVHTGQMNEERSEMSRFCGCIVNLDPGLNTHGRQHDIVRSANGGTEVVAGVLKEGNDGKASAWAGMVVCVVGKDEQFEIMPGRHVVFAL